MKLEHVAADKLFVDFAGKPLYYIDHSTSELVACQVFVAFLFLITVSPWPCPASGSLISCMRWAAACNRSVASQRYWWRTISDLLLSLLRKPYR